MDRHTWIRCNTMDGLAHANCCNHQISNVRSKVSILLESFYLYIKLIFFISKEWLVVPSIFQPFFYNQMPQNCCITLASRQDGNSICVESTCSSSELLFSHCTQRQNKKKGNYHQVEWELCFDSMTCPSFSLPLLLLHHMSARSIASLDTA